MLLKLVEVVVSVCSNLHGFFAPSATLSTCGSDHFVLPDFPQVWHVYFYGLHSLTLALKSGRGGGKTSKILRHTTKKEVISSSTMLKSGSSLPLLRVISLTLSFSLSFSLSLPLSLLLYLPQMYGNIY